MAQLRASAASLATAGAEDDTEQAEADQEQLTAFEAQLAETGTVEREQMVEWFKAALRETRCQNQGSKAIQRQAICSWSVSLVLCCDWLMLQ
jgi:hypothetical protein